MKRTSRAIRCALVLMMTAICLIAFTDMASANNNVDTSYTFNFSNNNKYTSPRAKYDDSCCYMYYNNGTISFKASARGQANTSISGPNSTDCSQGYKYQFTSAHQKRFMYNNVYESGLSYLRIKGESGSSGTAKGYWSPDSVYQATVLPPTDYIH